jgi:hypothetical protein
MRVTNRIFVWKNESSLRTQLPRTWCVYQVLAGTASPGNFLGEINAADMTSACARAFIRWSAEAELGIVVLEKKEA